MSGSPFSRNVISVNAPKYLSRKNLFVGVAMAFLVCGCAAHQKDTPPKNNEAEVTGNSQEKKQASEAAAKTSEAAAISEEKKLSFRERMLKGPTNTKQKKIHV